MSLVYEVREPLKKLGFIELKRSQSHEQAFSFIRQILYFLKKTTYRIKFNKKLKKK